MAYDSLHPASPFRQRVAEVLPEVLKPLKYCEFRDKLEGPCHIFACAEVLEMAFCFHHAKMILQELAAEGNVDVGSS